MVPAVVAARDLEPGEKLSLDSISRRDLPEQFVLPSVVKPDSVAYVRDLMLTVPLHPGDPVHWGFFAATRSVPEGKSPQDYKIWDACETALSAGPASRRERTAEEIRAHLEARRSEVAP